MQDKKNLRLEIVEYNESVATIEQVKHVFFENFKETTNMNSFSSISISMKRKYGIFSYVIMLALILIVALIFLGLLRLVTGEITANTWIISLVFGGALSWVFAQRLVKKIYGEFLNHGRNMLPGFDDIHKTYRKDGGNFWIALVHNSATNTKEIVGTLGLRRDVPQENGSQEASKYKKLGYISAVGVNNGYRGLGIGGKLCEEVLSFAEKNGYDYLALYTSVVNTPAVKLYEKYGFKVIGQMEILPLIGFAAHKLGRSLNA